MAIALSITSDDLNWEPQARCIYAAPHICYQHQEAKTWHIIQACCNHWDCPRCGIIRAKQEYARMVNGAETIEAEKRQMYFWTLTCRGKELSRDGADAGYLKWTDRLLTAARNRANRAGDFWCYVQVTERQKRGHPHSHMITTYLPPDNFPFSKGDMLPNHRRARHDCIWSLWFRDANLKAGLGAECDISAVQSAAAVSRYVAKYLFKQTALDTWPKGWKRIRYSQNWPKLTERENQTAFPVITWADWHRVWDLREPVRADSVMTYSMALARGVLNVIAPKW